MSAKLQVSVMVVCMLVLPDANRAEDLKVLPAKLGGLAPREMMHAYWMRLAGEALDRHDAEYEKLKTPEQLAGYQKRMREFFLAQLGDLPQRTPLNPQVTGRLEGDGYRVEKIIFESQPKHYVTALLYLPAAKPPYPGVLVPCGHSAEGKAMDAYQRACILLARNGLGVLCYDPIDQGERIQVLDPNGKAQVWGTNAHSLLAAGSILLGRSTASFRVWDGMRAIDYLQSRPEIDPNRIGCAGNSGGGTLTSYLMALDDRIQCAAPNCYLTSFRRLLEKLGPQDAEQDIHAQIAYGMDHAEYVIMRGPKPTLICAATQDFFDIRGTWDTFRKSKRFYTRQGFPERVELVEADQKHGFSKELRVATVRWMRRWLLGIDDAVTEADCPVLTEADARCAPGGQVMLLPGARNVYDLNADLEAKLVEQRKQFRQQGAVAGPPVRTASSEHATTLEQAQRPMLEEVRRITGIRKLADMPAPECTNVGAVSRKGHRIEKLILRPEADIWLPALAFVPEQRGAEATLYLHAEGKEVDAAPGGPIEQLVAKGHVVLAVDLRGLGETQPTGKDGPLGREWADVFLAYMLDTSYLAKRAEDVLVCARFLANYPEGGKPQKVHLVSIGPVGPAALHAAALEPQLFSTITLRDCVVSWSNVVRTAMPSNQLINVVHGALRVYDLPDLLATLPKANVTVIEPLDAKGMPIAGK